MVGLKHVMILLNCSSMNSNMNTFNVFILVFDCYIKFLKNKPEKRGTDGTSKREVEVKEETREKKWRNKQDKKSNWRNKQEKKGTDGTNKRKEELMEQTRGKRKWMKKQKKSRSEEINKKKRNGRNRQERRETEGTNNREGEIKGKTR